MEDRDFIDFKFGDHWASDFNLLAVSSGDRYSPPVYGSVNPNTATIAGKVGVYKWKTQVNEKVFNIKIAFDNINGQILNQIKEWLNPFKIDKLVFKEEPYKYYWVALNTEPKLDFLPFLEETKVVNGIAFKEGVYKGEFELQFVCFDNYGYSDWQSFDENYDYVVKEIEGEEFISFNDGSDNNLIITKIEGNSKQRTREEVTGTVINGNEMTINEEYISNKTQFVIDGNSEQKTYEGYNRLGEARLRKTYEGVTLVNNEDGSFTLNGTTTTSVYIDFNKTDIEKAGKYTILFNKNNTIETFGGYVRFVLLNDAEKIDDTSLINKVSYSVTFEEGNLPTSSYLWINAGNTFDNFTFYPMMYEGTEEKTYEPYVGGQPSPNPDYPQEVEIIDGVNIWDEEWENGAWTVGGAVSSNSVRSKNYIKILNKNIFFNTPNTVIYYITYDKNKTAIDRYSVGIPGKFVTLDDNVEYIRFNTAGTYTVYNNDITITKGTIPKPYLPHGCIGLRQSGKNKFIMPKTLSKNNVDYTLNDDGTCNIVGTASTYTSFELYVPIEKSSLKNGAYYRYSSNLTNIVVACAQWDKNYNYIRNIDIYGNKPFVIDSNCKYIGYTIGIFENTNVNIQNGKILLTEGQEYVDISQYEPYHEPKVIPINLNGNTLAKVGDVKDLLKVYRNGDVEIEKKIPKYILKGGTDEVWGQQNNLYFIFYTDDYTKWIKPVPNIDQAISNIGVVSYQVIDNQTGYGLALAYGIRINLKDLDVTKGATIEELRAYLAENPITVYTQLKEPETIKLPSIEPITLWEGTNKFELITNLNTNMSLYYNYVIPSPSPELESPVKSVGDNVNIFDGEIELGGIDPTNGTLIDNNSKIRSKNFIKVKPNTTYMFTRQDGKYRWIIGYTSSKKGIVDGKAQSPYPSAIEMMDLNISEKIFTTTNTTEYIKWYDSSSTNLNEKVKIVQGTKVTPWTPYGMGSAEINVCNKNFLQLELSDGVTNEDGSVTITNNTNYEISGARKNLTGKIPAGTYVINNISGLGLFIKFSSSDYTHQIGVGSKYIFDYDGVSYLEIQYINVPKGRTIIYKAQLEKGNITTDYIKHQSQTKTIPIQKPFRAIGDVRDKFVKVDGVWNEKHYISRIVLDGSDDENWSRQTTNTSGKYRFRTSTTNMKKATSTSEIVKAYSNFFIATSPLKTYNCTNGFCIDNKDYMFFYNEDFGYYTLEQFKQWLADLYNAGTPVYVDYILATPELIPCTEAQAFILNQLENELYSYEGTNYVFSTDKISPLLSISYIPKQDIYIDYVVNQSNLLNDSAFYYDNNIYKKSYFDAETGDATKSGISEDRPVYLYNAGTTAANLNLTFDMIIPAEGSPLVINTESCKLTDNGIQVLKQISSISISDFSKYKPFLEIYDGTPSNWQIQIDSNLCEIYLKHKIDKTKIISLNKFNDNQSFLSLANCKFVDYSKPFPTLITAIGGTALENTVFNKLSVGTSAQNYRLKNVNVEWKHTYL